MHLDMTRQAVTQHLRRLEDANLVATIRRGREEKHSRVAFEIEPMRGVVRLTVTHDRLEPGSEMLERITEGRPKVLSSMKSLLEAGRPLPKLW